MIGVLVIIFTVVLGLLEKPHLFKKPYKIEKIFFLILLVLTAGFSAYKEITGDIDQTKANGQIDSLTSRSTILQSLLDSSRKENRIAHIESMDSLARYQYKLTKLLAEYGIKVDTISNTLKNININGKKEIPPTLAILMPPVFATENNETVINYDLSALQAEVHLLSNSYAVVPVKIDSGHTYFKPPRSKIGGTNLTDIIPVNATMSKSYFIDRSIQSDSLGTLFYFVMEFTYKSKSNIRQTPLRKIYYVDYNKKSITNVTNHEFNLVAQFLRKFKIWEKFYDL